MSPDLLLRPQALFTDADVDGIDDGEFELDLRVIESTSRLVTLMCDTSDGCGNTCQGSACSSQSNDPF